MRANLFFCVAAIALSVHHDCSAALMGPGDIAFIGFNADGNDDFSFVTLAAISPSTSVYFRDDEWNGGTIGVTGAFNTGEGSMQWDSGATTISAGTVISVNNANSVSRTVNFGSFVGFSGSLSLDGIDEALWAYLGTDHTAPTVFLSVVANEAAPNATSPNLGGTGLTDGVNSQIIAGDEDIMAYIGARSGQTSFSDYLAFISNDANWITEDSAGSQHNNTTAPDVPFDSTAFTLSASAAPEPSALVLAIGGLLTIAVSKRRRRAD